MPLGFIFYVIKKEAFRNWRDLFLSKIIIINGLGKEIESEK